MPIRLKLTIEQRQEIVDKYKSGDPVKAIAYDYAISETTVTKIAEQGGAKKRR